MTGDLEAAAYERRRLLAALTGRPAPEGALRPLLAGVVAAAGIVAAQALGWPLP